MMVDIKIELTEAVKKAVVACRSLNVRSEPSMSASIVGLLSQGDEFMVLDEVTTPFESWLRCGDDEWVHGAWVKVTKGLATSEFILENVQPDYSIKLTPINS